MSLDDELLGCENELRHAQLNSDIAALDRLLDERLVFAGSDGTIASKSDDLSMHRAGRIRITRMDPQEYRLLHPGQTSVVSVACRSLPCCGTPGCGTGCRRGDAWSRGT